MKYLVQVKYTNPSHEHVSFRRRVETVNRIVEAASEVEAINRVTRQQRSLGFMIKEAEIVPSGGQMTGVNSPSEEPKKKKIVGSDEGETEIKKEPVKEEVKTANPGRGYHGEHPADQADAKYAAMHAKLRKTAVGGNASSKKIRDYLDSPHGRHLAGRENDSAYYSKDFEKFDRTYKPEMFKEEQIDEVKFNKNDTYSRSDAAKIIAKLRKVHNDKDFYHSQVDHRIKHGSHTNTKVSNMVKKVLANEEVEQTEEGYSGPFPAKWEKEMEKVPSTKTFRGKDSKGVYTSKTVNGKEVSRKYETKEEVESIDEARPMELGGPAYNSVSGSILKGKVDQNFGYAPNKMPPHLKAAQAKSDELSKVEKRPQAGTLAAQKANEEVEEVDEARKMSRVEWRMGTQDTVDANNYKIFKKLAATDPNKAKAFHDNLVRMKKKDMKEETDNKQAKGRKAAERMINLAKGKKNPINLAPTMDPYKQAAPLPPAKG